MVFGIGGVGLNVIQFAHLAGAYPIVAVDLLEGKLDMAKQRGATYVLNASKVSDLDGELRRIVGS